MLSEARFSSSKFIVSIPGLFKIAAMIMFLASSVMFLSTPVCNGTSWWYAKLYPISAAVSGILIAILFGIFAIGIAKRSYRVWALIDLIFNLLDFMGMLAVSIVTISHCSNAITSLQMVPAPMGIVGAIFLALSSAVWFVQNRGGNNLSSAQNTPAQGPNLYRKSVMV